MDRGPHSRTAKCSDFKLKGLDAWGRTKAEAHRAANANTQLTAAQAKAKVQAALDTPAVLHTRVHNIEDRAFTQQRLLETAWNNIATLTKRVHDLETRVGPALPPTTEIALQNALYAVAATQCACRSVGVLDNASRYVEVQAGVAASGNHGPHFSNCHVAIAAQALRNAGKSGG